MENKGNNQEKNREIDNLRKYDETMQTKS